MPPDDSKSLTLPRKVALAPLVTGPLALLFMGTVWGLGFTLAKIAGLNGAHPLGLIIWETIGSGFLLLAICAAFGRYPRLRWTYLRNYLVNGLLGFTIPGPLLFWAAPHLPVAVLTLMIPMAPLLTYVLIVALRAEKFDLIRALGVLAGFIGVALIVLPQGSLPEAGQVGWVLLALGASAFYAVQNVYIALHTPPDADVLTQTTGMLLFGGLLAVPVAIVTDGFLWPDWPMSIAVQAATVMLLINALLMFLYVWVLRTLGAVFASLNANIITVAGAMWGWLFFAEAPSAWIWAAMIAMALGVALVTLRRATPMPR